MKPMQDPNHEIIDISYPIPIFAIYMPIAILFLKKKHIPAFTIHQHTNIIEYYIAQ